MYLQISILYAFISIPLNMLIKAVKMLFKSQIGRNEKNNKRFDFQMFVISTVTRIPINIKKKLADASFF